MRSTRASWMSLPTVSLFFFFNDTATTEIYTLSLHDALPIFRAAAQVVAGRRVADGVQAIVVPGSARVKRAAEEERSEEHTSELQSRRDLVCRLLLEKKKDGTYRITIISRKLPSPCTVLSAYV